MTFVSVCTPHTCVDALRSSLKLQCALLTPVRQGSGRTPGGTTFYRVALWTPLYVIVRYPLICVSSRSLVYGLGPGIDLAITDGRVLGPKRYQFPLHYLGLILRTVVGEGKGLLGMWNVEPHWISESYCSEVASPP